MSLRCAIYFAPGRDTAWWNFGARWLGRDEQQDLPLQRPPLGGLQPQELEDITAQPRRYGFHATLKAPFLLRTGLTPSDLEDRLRAFARTRRLVPVGPVVPDRIDDFVALVPTAVNLPLQELACACVAELDDMRAPLTGAERKHRGIDSTDVRATELFERYGYPHVLERFRFHMTLTGPVEPALARRVVTELTAPIARLNVMQPLLMDRLCLFVEAGAGTNFKRVVDLELVS